MAGRVRQHFPHLATFDAGCFTGDGWIQAMTCGWGGVFSRRNVNGNGVAARAVACFSHTRNSHTPNANRLIDKHGSTIQGRAVSLGYDELHIWASKRLQQSDADREEPNLRLRWSETVHIKPARSA
jgi:hypothetical protein